MILLDTCVLLWLAASPERISPTAREHIAKAEGHLLVSATSAFEIGIKHRKGKLRLPLPPDQWFAEVVDFHGLREIPINREIAVHSTLLPPLHSDPCDRFLMATAQLGKYKLLTPDHLITSYPDVETVW